MKIIEKVSLFILIVFLSISFLSIVWTPYNPYDIHIEEALQHPSAAHLLGTDALGRDVLSRLMVGSRVTIGFALLAAFCTSLLGVALGIISGYGGKYCDLLVQSLVTVFQGIPGISFMIALAGVLEPGVQSMVIAIVLTSWTGFSKVIRGEVLAIKNEIYMEGIRALGGKSWYIVTRYICRMLIPICIVLFATRVSFTILATASLSFLGLGIQPPLADWGAMVEEGQTYFRTYPILLYGPGFCILALSSSINWLGEYIKRKYA